MPCIGPLKLSDALSSSMAAAIDRASGLTSLIDFRNLSVMGVSERIVLLKN